MLAFFGDGASSQGDVNEAFVWAGAGNLPVVFFCQNNQWAISEPVERAEPGAALPAGRGFGFPGVRVDGNDVLACLAVTRKALDDARNGAGPDAHRGVHLPDGPAHDLRRPAPLPAGQRGRDLEAQGPDRAGAAPTSPARPASARDFFDGVEAEADELAEHVRAGCRALPDPTPVSVFDHVLREHAADLRRRAARRVRRTSRRVAARRPALST